jgi:hypothetical protein
MLEPIDTPSKHVRMCCSSRLLVKRTWKESRLHNRLMLQTLFSGASGHLTYIKNNESVINPDSARKSRFILRSSLEEHASKELALSFAFSASLQTQKYTNCLSLQAASYKIRTHIILVETAEDTHQHSEKTSISTLKYISHLDVFHI